MEPLDTKVYGILLKRKDNQVIPPDEFIVFRPADNALVDTLVFYLGKCQELGAAPEHLEAVHGLLRRVREWRGKHPERCKVPDTDPATEY